MAIQKTTLVSLIGRLENLDEVVLRLSRLDYFHPEEITSKSGAVSKAASAENPYTELADALRSACTDAGLTPVAVPGDQLERSSHDLNLADVRQFVESFRQGFDAADQKEKEIAKLVEEHRLNLSHLDMIRSFHTSFDELFKAKYLKVRFGRLPLENYKKLEHYQDKPFFLFTFSSDKNYQWCLYLTGEQHAAEVDSIMEALYFERVRIPDYLHGEPEDAASYLEGKLAEEQAALEGCKGERDRLVEEGRETLLSYYATVQFMQETYGVRRFVGTSFDKFAGGDYFEFAGYVPAGREGDFEALFGDLPTVVVTAEKSDDGAVPMLPGLVTHSMKEAHEKGTRPEKPTKLKNNWFARPFEMYVEMYGVPSHREIDPTPLVAFTYTLLFGIMFGDVGQGLLLVLGGFLFAKWKKSRLGEIIMRMGISSTLFGFLYGSVFGFEHALDPLYRAIGFAEKPVEVMNAQTINVLLIGAVALGVVLILTSMALNIYIGLKNRDYSKALFSQNGVAGFVLYATVISAIGLPMLGISFSLNLPIILICIVIPIICIFMRVPLGNLLLKKGAFPEGGFGAYALENIFEMLEIAISFVANTMSFLRVGGFILSHAGMMSVVFTLAGMFGPVGYAITVALGNLFVIGLEGLVVGIQVLRLEFYEMFGRYYSGEGVPFTPISQIVHEHAN